MEAKMSSIFNLANDYDLVVIKRSIFAEKGLSQEDNVNITEENTVKENELQLFLENF